MPFKLSEKISTNKENSKIGNIITFVKNMAKAVMFLPGKMKKQ